MTDARAAQDAQPFSSATVAWLVGISAASALLFMVLTAYAPQLRGGADGGVHALSKSAVGTAGLERLLRAEGVPVVLSRDARTEARTNGLLILTPNFDTDAKALTGLASPSDELVVLPKWNTAPDPDHPGWVIGLGPAPTAQADAVLHAFDHGDHIVRNSGRAVLNLKTYDDGRAVTVPAGAIDSLQAIAGPDPGWIALASDQFGDAILIRKADSPVYVLSDPDLLNNQGLAQPANALGASMLINALRGGGLKLQGGRGPVIFDLTLAGFTRSHSLLGLAFEPPFLAVTLCALAGLVLMGLQAAVRFGAPARPPRAFAFGKRALADNSAALIKLAGREHRMGAGYAALTRALAADAVGAPRDLNDDQLDRLLDRLGRTRGVDTAFTELARDARLARDAGGLMTAARGLHHWRLEMTRERR